MTTAAAARVRAAAGRLGADIEERGGRGELDVSIWLPAGLVWSATGTHSLSAHYFSDPATGWAALWADMEKGTERCVGIECDTYLEG